MFIASSITAIFGLIIFKYGRYHNDQFRKEIVNHLKQIIFYPKIGPNEWTPKKAKDAMQTEEPVADLPTNKGKDLNSTHDSIKLLSPQ